MSGNQQLLAAYTAGEIDYTGSSVEVNEYSTYVSYVFLAPGTIQLPKPMSADILLVGQGGYGGGYGGGGGGAGDMVEQPAYSLSAGKYDVQVGSFPTAPECIPRGQDSHIAPFGGSAISALTAIGGGASQRPEIGRAHV